MGVAELLQPCILWRSSALERSRAAQDRRNRHRENLQVEPQRPVLDILAVETHDLFEVDDGAPSLYLPQTGDSGLRAESVEVAILVGREIGFEEGTRSDE